MNRKLLLSIVCLLTFATSSFASKIFQSMSTQELNNKLIECAKTGRGFLDIITEENAKRFFIGYARYQEGDKSKVNLKGTNGALALASKYGHTKIVLRLLTFPLIEDSFQGDGACWAFRWALEFGHIEILKLLVKYQEHNLENFLKEYLTPKNVHRFFLSATKNKKLDVLKFIVTNKFTTKLISITHHHDDKIEQEVIQIGIVLAFIDAIENAHKKILRFLISNPITKKSLFILNKVLQEELVKKIEKNNTILEMIEFLAPYEDAHELLGDEIIQKVRPQEVIYPCVPEFQDAFQENDGIPDAPELELTTLKKDELNTVLLECAKTGHHSIITEETAKKFCPGFVRKCSKKKGINLVGVNGALALASKSAHTEMVERLLTFPIIKDMLQPDGVGWAFQWAENIEIMKLLVEFQSHNLHPNYVHKAFAQGSANNKPGILVFILTNEFTQELIKHTKHILIRRDKEKVIIEKKESLLTGVVEAFIHAVANANKEILHFLMINPITSVSLTNLISELRKKLIKKIKRKIKTNCMNDAFIGILNFLMTDENTQKLLGNETIKKIARITEKYKPENLFALPDMPVIPDLSDEIPSYSISLDHDDVYDFITAIYNANKEKLDYFLSNRIKKQSLFRNQEILHQKLNIKRIKTSVITDDLLETLEFLNKNKDAKKLLGEEISQEIKKIVHNDEEVEELTKKMEELSVQDVQEEEETGQNRMIDEDENEEDECEEEGENEEGQGFFDRILNYLKS